MNKLTKKEISNFLKTKKTWSNECYNIKGKGVMIGIYVLDNQPNFFISNHIFGTPACVYNKTCEKVYDFKEQVESWASGKTTKEYLVNYIYDTLNESI